MDEQRKEEEIRELLQELAGVDIDTKESALNKLQNMRNEHSGMLLRLYCDELLESRHDESTLACLADSITKELARMGLKGIECLDRIVRSAKSPSVSESALKALFEKACKKGGPHLEVARETFSHAICDEAARIRCWALKLMRDDRQKRLLPKKEQIELLERLLIEDPSQAVKAFCINTLRKYEAKSAIPKIVETLEGSRQAYLDHQCILAMRQFGIEDSELLSRAKEMLKSKLESESCRIRREAAISLKLNPEDFGIPIGNDEDIRMQSALFDSHGKKLHFLCDYDEEQVILLASRNRDYAAID